MREVKDSHIVFPFSDFMMKKLINEVYCPSGYRVDKVLKDKEGWCVIFIKKDM